MPLLPPTDGPRSPLRVAVITFGAVVLIGMVVSLAVMGITGTLGDHPFERGEKLGQGLGPLGLIAAAIAYVVQKRKLDTLEKK
ncbi:MAG: hypothetical protein JNL83_26895 [Myxococcales bacterium]|nr:hypothetical protein [Myxococcales bacterium]